MILLFKYRHAQTGFLNVSIYKSHIQTASTKRNSKFLIVLLPFEIQSDTAVKGPVFIYRIHTVQCSPYVIRNSENIHSGCFSPYSLTCLSLFYGSADSPYCKTLF